jgi:hypothetical protein
MFSFGSGLVLCYIGSNVIFFGAAYLGGYACTTNSEIAWLFLFPFIAAVVLNLTTKYAIINRANQLIEDCKLRGEFKVKLYGDTHTKYNTYNFDKCGILNLVVVLIFYFGIGRFFVDLIWQIQCLVWGLIILFAWLSSKHFAIIAVNDVISGANLVPIIGKHEHKSKQEIKEYQAQRAIILKQSTTKRQDNINTHKLYQKQQKKRNVDNKKRRLTGQSQLPSIVDGAPATVYITYYLTIGIVVCSSIWVISILV